MCPVSVRRQEPLVASHTLSVRSPDPDTRRQCDRTTTQLTCSPDCSDALFDRTPAPHGERVIAQRRHAADARLGCHGLRIPSSFSLSSRPRCWVRENDQARMSDLLVSVRVFFLQSVLDAYYYTYTTIHSRSLSRTVVFLSSSTTPSTRRSGPDWSHTQCNTPALSKANKLLETSYFKLR